MTRRITLAAALAVASMTAFISCAPDAGQPLPAAQPQGGVIEGIVREIGTERPIAGATVYVVPSSNRPTPRTTTDAGGRFVLSGVEEGRHLITASRQGYVFPDRFEVSGSTFRVAGNPRIDAGSIYLVPAGSLTGRVSNPDGSPARKVEVQLLRNTYVMGRRQWTYAMPEGTRSRIETNQNGEFRIVGVDPGEVLVRFTPREVTAESVIPGGKPPGPALYPGVRDPASAIPVIVSAGRETRLDDMKLMVDQRGWIKVYVMDRSEENLEGFGQWSMEPPGWVGSGYLLFQDRIVGNAHEFQPDLPGRYVISAQWSTKRGLVGGRLTVNYTGQPLELGLTVQKPQGSVSGVVMLRQTSGGTRPLEGVEVSIGPEIAYFGRTGQDGMFLLSGVFAGRYKLGYVRDMPPDAYVISATGNNRDILREDLVVSAATKLDILIGEHGGTIAGVVTNKEGKPVHNALVALVPQGDLTARTDYYGAWQSTHSDQDGVFDFRGAAPGRYHAYAWLGAPASAFRSDEFLRRSGGMETSVTVRAGEKVSLELQVVEAKGR